MDCRQCNWYLCDECHPQQKEKEDWFWGSVSFFMEQASQEVSEIAAEFQEMAGEFETFMSDMAFTSSCSVVETAKIKKDEMLFDDKMNPNSKKQQKADSQKRSRSANRNLPEANRKKKPVEEEVSASAAEAHEEEEGLVEGPSTPQAILGKTSRSKFLADATRVEAQDEETSVPVVPEVSAPPAAPHMEDLLDIGQNDLLDLDLDLEPKCFAKKEPEKPMAASAAKGGLTSTTAAQQDLLDLDLDCSAATKPTSTNIEEGLIPDFFQ